MFNHPIPNITTTLYGSFKGETGDYGHLIPLTETTGTVWPLWRFFAFYEKPGRLLRIQGRLIFQRKSVEIEIFIMNMYKILYVEGIVLFKEINYIESGHVDGYELV